MEHAKAIANAIATMDEATRPTKVYASPFLRTTHTASIVASALPTDTQVNVEEGLYEYMQPSLLIDRAGVRTYPRSVDQLAEIFDNLLDTTYEKALEITEEMFPEDEEKLIARCTKTLDGILKHANGESLAIVLHAPCYQSVAFALEGVELKDSKVGKLAQGGITRFSKASDSDQWNMDYYGVTDHMPGDYKAGMGIWSLPCFSGTK